jgi:hypothetical protein
MRRAACGVRRAACGGAMQATTPPERAAAIRKLSWMDNKLYQHFNATLWKKIGAAEGFAEELAELRRQKVAIAESCREFANLDVDGHRVRMLGEKGMIDEHEMKCHLMQIDSEGFVKYLKQWSGIRHLECHRQGRPLKSAVVVSIPDTGCVTFVLVLFCTSHLPVFVHGLADGFPYSYMVSQMVFRIRA